MKAGVLRVGTADSKRREPLSPYRNIQTRNLNSELRKNRSAKTGKRGQRMQRAAVKRLGHGVSRVYWTTTFDFVAKQSQECKEWEARTANAESESTSLEKQLY